MATRRKAVAAAADERVNGAANGMVEVQDVQEHRKYRASRLTWIRIGDMQIPLRSQRKFRQSRVDHLAARFDLEGMGFLVVNIRDGVTYLIDGQHRRAALLEIGFSEDDVLQCETYEGLTEQQEAELFLERGDRLAVAPLDKFLIGVTAGHQAENEIMDAVRSLDLYIGRVERGGIMCVGTLQNVYRRVGVEGLIKVLRIVRDAYGDSGFEAQVVEGLGLAEQRYEKRMHEERMVKALATAAGGMNGLLTQANKTRVQLGQPRPACTAATTVGFYNRQAASGKLAPWWKESS